MRKKGAILKENHRQKNNRQPEKQSEKRSFKLLLSFIFSELLTIWYILISSSSYVIVNVAISSGIELVKQTRFLPVRKGSQTKSSSAN